MLNQANVNTATLIFVRGLPGSGKSYVARALSSKLGNGVVSLDPDTIDYGSDEYKAHCEALRSEGVDESLFAYRYSRAQAYQAIANRGTIIWNQPFTNLNIFNKMTANMYREAEVHGVKLTVLVVEVQIDPARAFERVAKRKKAGGHGPSRDVFERFVRDYQPFAPHGYNTVTVQGDDNIDHSMAMVLAQLQA